MKTFHKSRLHIITQRHSIVFSIRPRSLFSRRIFDVVTLICYLRLLHKYGKLSKVKMYKCFLD